MPDPGFALELVILGAGILGSFLLVRFKVDQLERNIERDRTDDAKAREERRNNLMEEYGKFQTDVWREINKLRDFRHDFPGDVQKWQQHHENEANIERLKLHDKVSDMRVTIAANEQKFEQIMEAIDDIKETLNGLRK